MYMLEIILQGLSYNINLFTYRYMGVCVNLRPMQTDPTSANNSKHCWVLLANNVASVCMGQKVWPVSNFTQQVPTSANIVVVPCKRTQLVTTLLGPTVLGIVGQQYWVTCSRSKDYQLRIMEHFEWKFSSLLFFTAIYFSIWYV